MAKANKGPPFEREIAVLLSQWWAGRDDVFWRSSTSGARATQRAKTGRTTAGQYGDIAAIDPCGTALIDVITFELKAGYTTQGIHDLLDYKPTAGIKDWELFIDKAIHSHQQAGSMSWAIVTRRTSRITYIWGPQELMAALRGVGAFTRRPRPWVELCVNVRTKSKQRPAPGWVKLWGCPLVAWLGCVAPHHIRELSRIG